MMGVLLRHWNTEVQGRLQLYEMILNGKMESLSQLPFLGVEQRQASCPLQEGAADVLLWPENLEVQGRLQTSERIRKWRIEALLRLHCLMDVQGRLLGHRILCFLEMLMYFPKKRGKCRKF